MAVCAKAIFTTFYAIVKRIRINLLRAQLQAITDLREEIRATLTWQALDSARFASPIVNGVNWAILIGV